MTQLLSMRGMARSFYSAQVLTGVELDIPEGCVTGLIGPNGAGKSTFFNILSRLNPPDGGRVLLAEQDVRALDAHNSSRPGRCAQIADLVPLLIPAPLSARSAACLS